MNQLPVHTFGQGRVRGLWLHGWLGQGEEGEALQPHLGPTFTLICPDLPGHGAAPFNGWTLTHTLTAIAELAATCDWAGGYSMGGRLLMMAAARHPEAFKELVIESASPGLADDKARAERRETDARRAADLCARGLTAFCRDWYAQEMWAGLATPLRQGEAAALAEALTCFSLGNQPDLRQWLRFSAGHILWLAGSQDPAYAAHAAWVRQHCHHTVEIFNAGHNVHLQQPRAWAMAIRNFIERKSGFQEQ